MALLLTGQWGAAEAARWLQVLQQAMPAEQWLIDAPRDAAEAAAIEMAVVANPPPGRLQGLPNLRLIQSLWAGVDRLLADPTLPAGVPLARMVDPAMNEAMAQTALWAVLALHRGFFDVQAQQAQRLWRQPAQCRAAEWRVLVLGLGELGGRVAAALLSQGYTVEGWSRSPRQVPGVQCCSGAELVGALARADTVINLLPLTDQTRGFFDAQRLALFKPGASLINLARGAHVIDADLLAALDAGQLRRAVLDVFHQEPLAAEHPFWSHAGVTVLPHTAAQTDPRSAAAVVAANLQALRAGRPLAHRVEAVRGY
ncbi:glyoxylate/hydroxypyruvate reductase A [Paucibacter sp. APW11]|uniref:Glyoxylate/hydroxypyruvate reductase A n=1 Tax=Roseateles aquae TaxID=3077235 RepID=A0ABU3PA34_9BURK|nr:glyoxylate/hydroxypyruvate reductase A [Paucibacter sp. APW11]MDT8999445.1 glyoxylate/hydroxypyruvate reductase A [Paucibacter sp. APW11]